MATQTQSRREFHPAVSILSWLIFAVTVELAAVPKLQWLLVAALLLLADCDIRTRFYGLALKARWLWLAMLVLYGWTVPGILLWPAAWSPTVDGLMAGWFRVERLLLLLIGLAGLLSVLRPAQLAAGIYQLSAPLTWLGLDRRALAVRLVLTLDQIENTPKAGHWLPLLKSSQTVSAEPGELCLRVSPVRALDVGVLTLVLALLGWMYLAG